MHCQLCLQTRIHCLSCSDLALLAQITAVTQRTRSRTRTRLRTGSH